jgi:MiaB-like tRNA modifying enzyme
MKAFVKSFGCSSNLADGEVLAGCLAKAGYKLVNDVKSADVIVYNTCAVKGPTENRMIDILKRVPTRKKLVVAGCLPLINFERLSCEVCFDGVVGPAVGDRIVDVVARVLRNERVVALEETAKSKPSLGLPRLLLNPVVSIVPINYGCLGSCAYCCVVFARGSLRSYGIQEIVSKAKRDLAARVREFWLTSQDSACYGRDVGTNLAELLKAFCGIKGDFRVRVGMMAPNLVADILEDLIDAFQSDKVFKFVHLPLQSGDEQVLKQMRRFYTPEDFRSIVETFRTSFPDITVATDVICGFPGESEEAFEKSFRLIEEVKPDIVNVSKFFARPRTAAAKMQEDFVSPSEIKRRSSVMASLVKKIAFEKNRHWIGWAGEILVDEVGKVPKSWVGRNFAYKPIVVKNIGDGNLLGEILHVKVVRAFETYLECDIFQ